MPVDSSALSRRRYDRVLVWCGLGLLNLLGFAVIAWFVVRGSASPGVVPAAPPEVLEAGRNAPGSPAKGLDQPAEPKQLAAVDAPNAPNFAPLAPALPSRPEPRVLTTREIVAQSEESVALINGLFGFGTGFVVGPGLVATNAHVISSEPIHALEIHFPSAAPGDRGPLKARLRYKDSRRDLALLAVETRLPPLELSRSHVFKRGEDVTIIGNPGLSIGEVVLQNAVGRGVLSTEVDLDGQHFFQLDVAANPGNSGGPVFNSQGEVIGVVTLRDPGKQSLAFCIPVGDLVSALHNPGARTRDQLARVEKLHDVESILRRLHLAGRANLEAIEHYLSLMSQALDQGDLSAVAITAARRAIEPTLVALNRKLTDGVPEAINEYVADLELALPIRRDLSELWSSFTALRDLAEGPQGDALQFSTRYQRSQRNFQDRVDDLKRDLGVDLED